MKTPSLLLIALLSTILLTSCDEQTLTPALPILRGEKVTYHFESGFSYRILQYDDKGKVKSLVSGITYPDDGTFENTYELIYEGNVLKETRSQDVTVRSFEYSYGTNGQVSETSVFQNDKLKELYEFSYDIEGNLVSEITWSSSTDGELFPASQRKFKYDYRHNLIEIRQFTAEGEDFILVTTIVYSDYDNKVNSEYMFMNNLYHPFLRFFKNNPRSVRLTHENGTSAEQKFLYEYNSQDHVTKRRIENDPTSIDYEYIEFK